MTTNTSDQPYWDILPLEIQQKILTHYVYTTTYTEKSEYCDEPLRLGKLAHISYAFGQNDVLGPLKSERASMFVAFRQPISIICLAKIAVGVIGRDEPDTDTMCLCRWSSRIVDVVSMLEKQAVSNLVDLRNDFS